jgi:hypothetical protein
MGERSSDLSREAVERLLAGRADTPVALAQLLSAARAPALPGDLDGEDTAAAMFRRTHMAPGAAPVHRGTAKRTTVRLLAGAGAIAVAGSVSVAAATGALPGSGSRAVHPSASRPAVPKVAVPDRARQVPSGPAATTTPGPDVTASRPGPTPELLGLCRAYLAMPPREAERVLGTPAFAPLAARTPDVRAFCTALAATPTPAAGHGRPTAKPPKRTPQPKTSKTKQGGDAGRPA